MHAVIFKKNFAKPLTNTKITDNSIKIECICQVAV